MTFKWEEITKGNLTYLDKVLHLYDQAFPIDIREPHDIFYKGLTQTDSNQRSKFRMLVGLKDGEPVSFATGHYLAKVNCGFIVYLGTAQNVRSRGLGSEALLRIEECLNQDAVLAGHDSIIACVLETEKLEEAKTDASIEACLKRDHFYRKNGYKLIEEIDYLQPPLNGGNHAIPLKLHMKKRKQIDVMTAKVQQIIFEMYDKKYFLMNMISIEVLNDCLKEMSIPERIRMKPSVM